MPKGHDIEALQVKAKRLVRGFNQLSKTDDPEELIIKVFPRPGWTTPAEYLLVNALLDATLAQLKVVAQMRQSLVQGSQQIGG